MKLRQQCLFKMLFTDTCFPAIKQNGKNREDYKHTCKDKNIRCNGSADCQRIAECMHTVAEWHKRMNRIIKSGGCFNRIGTCRSPQLQYHEYQNNKASDFSTGDVKENDHGHEACGNQCRHGKGKQRLIGRQAVNQHQHTDHNNCHQCGDRIHNRSLASPHTQTGRRFTCVFQQRIHKSKGHAGNIQPDRHHIGRHRCTIVFHIAQFLMSCDHRLCQHFLCVLCC